MIRAHLNVPKIEARDSREIFALFIALNALGYDDENNPSGMAAVRKRARTVIKSGHDWRTRYPIIARAMKRHHAWYLLQAVLNASPSISSRGFVSSVKKFSSEPLVKIMWETTKGSRMNEMDNLFPLFKRVLVQLIKFLKKWPRNIKKVVLIVNPLDAYWRGYALKIKSSGYIIAGPGATKNDGELLRHELLHLIAPLFRIPKKLAVSTRSLERMGYKNNRIVKHETVVRALNLIYQKQALRKSIKSAIKREKRYFPQIEKIINYLLEKMERSYPSK